MKKPAQLQNQKKKKNPNPNNLKLTKILTEMKWTQLLNYYSYWGSCMLQVPDSAPTWWMCNSLCSDHLQRSSLMGYLIAIKISTHLFSFIWAWKTPQLKWKEYLAASTKHAHTHKSTRSSESWVFFLFHPFFIPPIFPTFS